MSVRILHAADLHLDSPFEALSGAQAAQRRREQRDLLRALPELAKAHGAEIILLAGDLLDSGSPYPETAKALAETFAGCASDNLEDAFKIKETLKYLDYYNANLNINRDSTLIATYIESNGIEEITTTPGTGFYANEENHSSSHKVGLSNSPLYDDESITYHGDFMIRRKYGVKLNSYYEETSYSDTSCCFRDNYIDFSPDDGECIYSGDYLFCFASNGTLIDFAEID